VDTNRPSAALFSALAVSLAAHALALFVPWIDLSSRPAPPPLIAELRPAPPASPPPVVPARKLEKAPAAKRPAARKPVAPVTPAPMPAAPAPDTFAATDEAVSVIADRAASAIETKPPAPAAPPVSFDRLPSRGRIRFRVDLGDSGFEIGFARQEWTFEAERYRLVSSVETSGLASLIRSVDIDMESLGQFSESGLRPEVFGIMRSGKKARERALFDWETMKIRVGDDDDYTLDPGTQDLLSFYYQLAFLDIPPGRTGAMPLATGKKYSVYRLENLGDETIEIPLGTLNTRRLRSPGENATEIWLAYDYHLLPVKVRHVDNKGKVFVQVATEVLFGSEARR
jgi:hypothetical protein